MSQTRKKALWFVCFFFLGIVLLAAGGFIGFGLASAGSAPEAQERQLKLALAHQEAGELLVWTKCIETLNRRATDEALRIAIMQFDFHVVTLSYRHSNDPINLNSMNFALAYRKTNSWMDRFEDTSGPGSAMIQDARRLTQEQH